MIEINGQLRGDGRRFGIVVGRFNEFVTRRLLSGAHDCLLRHGVSDDDVEAVWVPGAWEVPHALGWLASTDRFDGLIALGAVIRGATPHFDFVAGQATAGVAAVERDSKLPTAFGILTTDTVEQAVERAGAKAGNKGWDAAAAVLEMVDLEREIRRSGRTGGEDT